MAVWLASPSGTWKKEVRKGPSAGESSQGSPGDAGSLGYPVGCVGTLTVTLSSGDMGEEVDLGNTAVQTPMF